MCTIFNQVFLYPHRLNAVTLNAEAYQQELDGRASECFGAIDRHLQDRAGEEASVISSRRSRGSVACFSSTRSEAHKTALREAQKRRQWAELQLTLAKRQGEQQRLETIRVATEEVERCRLDEVLAAKDVEEAEIHAT